MKFDEQYGEDARLEDGQPIHLRLVCAEDKALMIAAWERLSPESRYRRFLAPKVRLTQGELAYFTETDNVNHLAIGASRTLDGEEQAVGVARFVRLKEHPDVADASIAVTDDVHGKGLGRMLLSRLVAAARERGIAYFVSDVLQSNVEMRALFRSLSPDIEEHDDGGVVQIRMPLAHALATEPLPPTIHPKNPLARLLALYAKSS